MDKKQILVLATTFALVLGMMMVGADTETHSTSLSIGNAVPTITAVLPVANVDLSPDSTTDVTIIYNVTDTNGASDIDDAEAKVYLSKVGETTRSNATGECIPVSVGNVKTYTCTVDMYFYDGAGAWTINVTAKDAAAVLAFNDTTTLTVNVLDDVSFNDSAISCGSGLISPSNDNKCEDLSIKNIGNQDYTTFTETGYDTRGASLEYEIAASQFSVNTTDAATGTALSNASGVVIPEAALTAGAANYEILYTYTDIPSGRPADTYTSISDWSIATT